MCSYDLQHKYRVNYLQFPEEPISIYRNTGEENTNYRGLQIHAKGEVHWKFFLAWKIFLNDSDSFFVFWKLELNDFWKETRITEMIF